MEERMKKNLKLTFQKGDILAIGLTLLLALFVGAAFLPEENSGNATVQIWQDGEMIRQLPLEEDNRLEIAGQYRSLVVIENGRVWMEESDCPGEDCVHSGSVGSVGRSIICLPNRVEIRIVGEDADEVDFVVG